MKNMDTVAVQITKEKNGYSAIAVGLFGVCTTEAKTYKETISNMKEAISLHMDGLRSVKRKLETSVVLLPVHA